MNFTTGVLMSIDVQAGQKMFLKLCTGHKAVIVEYFYELYVSTKLRSNVNEEVGRVLLVVHYKISIRRNMPSVPRPFVVPLDNDLFTIGQLVSPCVENPDSFK